MSFQHIVNPITREYIQVNSIEGIQLLRRYVMQLNNQIGSGKKANWSAFVSLDSELTQKLKKLTKDLKLVSTGKNAGVASALKLSNYIKTNNDIFEETLSGYSSSKKNMQKLISILELEPFNDL